MHSRIVGDYDFPHDPDMPSDIRPPVWSPQVRPQAVPLCAVEHQHAADAQQIVALAHLSSIDLRQAPDGWHGIWHADGVEHQFWIRDGHPDAATFYEARLPMDEFMELRAHAVRRFWRSLKGRTPGTEYRSIPTQLRDWHIQSLRALDARLIGESYRTVAEVLFGFRGTKEDFEVDPRKNKARRLVAHGMKMMRGGYRLLLHYPIKLSK